MGGEGGTGGRSLATQLEAEVKWQDGRGSVGVELGAPLVQADRLGEAGAHRVGRLSIVEPESSCFQAFARLQPVLARQQLAGCGCPFDQPAAWIHGALALDPGRQGACGGGGRSAGHGFRASETTMGQYLMGAKHMLVPALLPDR